MTLVWHTIGSILFLFITTYFDNLPDHVTFDTECVDSETFPISPSSNSSESTLTFISNEDYVVGGPETRYLFTIFSLQLNFSST